VSAAQGTDIAGTRNWKQVVRIGCDYKPLAVTHRKVFALTEQAMLMVLKLSRLVGVGLLFSSLGAAQPAPSSDLEAKIDAIARKALTSTGVPSASIAIVQDGKITYLQAYGQARLDPSTPARPEMRYSIGSISKQFTAAAVILLAEQGKLSLDDPVSRFVPNLTRGHEVTIRQILSHTSGAFSRLSRCGV
jgi:D-alanyl-D-alanine carboxypeptidase